MKKFLFLIAIVLCMSINAQAIDYYLIGEFNHWTFGDPTTKFTAKSADVYELDYEGTLTTGFKINDGSWENSNANIGAATDEALLKSVPFYCSIGSNSQNILMDAPIINPNIVLNLAKRTITISGVVGWQLHGSFTSSEWGGPKFTKVSDNKFDKRWIVFVECTQQGSFGIKKLGDDGLQTDWYNATKEVAVNGEAYDIPLKSEGTNFTIEPSATGYTMMLHTDNMTLDVKKGDVTTGIADIEIDSTVAPVYYNLQGVRVENAENGVFIEVRGNKATKVIR